MAFSGNNNLDLIQYKCYFNNLEVIKKINGAFKFIKMKVLNLIRLNGLLNFMSKNYYTRYKKSYHKVTTTRAPTLKNERVVKLTRYKHPSTL